jgi:flagellar biosynthesis/type III secretory pathway chaperone
MDRDSNFKLKGITSELKSVVNELKEAIVINDKLLKNRKEFLNHTIESLKEHSKEKVYTIWILIVLITSSISLGGDNIKELAFVFM